MGDLIINLRIVLDLNFHYTGIWDLNLCAMGLLDGLSAPVFNALAIHCSSTGPSRLCVSCDIWPIKFKEIGFGDLAWSHLAQYQILVIMVMDLQI